MTRRFGNALRLFLLLQWRFRFFHVYLGLAVLTVVAFRVALPESWAAWLVPAFLLGEPGTLGVTLVAAQVYLERNQGSVTALAVTPLRSGEHVLALAVTSALVATLAGAVVQGGVLGLDGRLALLLAPLFVTATLAGLLGLGLSTYFSEFTRFLIAGLTPALVLLSLPYLSYFELLPRAAFVWVPSDAALFSFANLARVEPDATAYLVYGMLLLGYSALAFVWARRAFERRLRGRLAQA